MRRIVLLCCLLGLIPFFVQAQTLAKAEHSLAVSSVLEYLDLLNKLAQDPMGDASFDIRDRIIDKFENRYDTPVYNEFSDFEKITNMGTACTIDDYLLVLGHLYEEKNYLFRMEYMQVRTESYGMGNDMMKKDEDTWVYVDREINGADRKIALTNVFRVSIQTGKISYIEKGEFTTNDEDIQFLLKNQAGYSPSKLNEMAHRCYKDKKYKYALQLFEQAAIREDYKSQMSLATMYLNREGCGDQPDVVNDQLWQFWGRKVFFGTNGAWKSKEMFDYLMNKLFAGGKKIRVDSEKKPFNSGLMKCIEGNTNKKYGFMNLQGNMVIPMQYQYAWAFSEGVAGVSDSTGKSGYINNKGEVVIPFIYKEITPFVGGVAVVSKEGLGYFLIDKEGKQVSDVYNYMYPRFDDSQKLMLVRKKINSEYRYGFINSKGIVKVPFIYENFARTGENNACSIQDASYYAICLKGKWGVIDLSAENGRILVKTECEKIGCFHYGIGKIFVNNQCWYIDINGNIIAGPYENGAYFGNDGYAVVIPDMKKNKAFVIDRKGKICYTCLWKPDSTQKEGWKVGYVQEYKGKQPDYIRKRKRIVDKINIK